MCTDPNFMVFNTEDDVITELASSRSFYRSDKLYYRSVDEHYVVHPRVSQLLRFYELAGSAGMSNFYGKSKIDGSSAGLKFYILPCGKCIECLLRHSSDWALRLMHEASFHPASCFLTLTYSDDNLVFASNNRPTLFKRHLQLFFKRLRKRFPHIKFRYYACGEYGDTTERPHYHAVLFGYDFSEDRKLYKVTSQKHKLYNSDVLSNLWGLGHCVIGELTHSTASYVARYVAKKLKPLGSISSAQTPEFSVMSNRPGIGYLSLEQYGKQFLEQGYVLNSKKRKCFLPRYYRKKLAELYPELYAKYEEKFLSKLDIPDFEDLFRRHKYREAIHQQFSRSAI